MNFVLFSLLILGFVYINLLSPEPKTPILETFVTLSQNIAKYDLFEKDIEKLAYSYCQLLFKQNPTQLEDSLKYYVKQSIRAKKRAKTAFLNICNLALRDQIQSTKIIKIICQQITLNAANTVDEKNITNLLYWAVFHHSIKVGKLFAKKKRELMKIASIEGAYLSNKFYSIKEICYWDPESSLCRPNLEEYKLIYSEGVYSALIGYAERAATVLKGKRANAQQLYSLLERTGLKKRIMDGTLVLNDPPEIQEKTKVKEVLRKFQTVAIEILSRKLNIVIQNLRAFKISHDLKAVADGAKYKQTISQITAGVYLDLTSAFKRCSKKNFYCPCSKLNDGMVSFKCQNTLNDEEKDKLTYYLHKCPVQFHRSIGASDNSEIDFDVTLINGKYPELVGEIFPWMFGDGFSFTDDQQKTL